MKKESLIVFTVLTLSSSFLYGSQVVTAPLNGSRLKFVAEEGAFVKKGESLFIYSTTSTDARLRAAKAQIAAAEENLKEKESNFTRYNELTKNNAVSAEKLEEIDLSYDEAVYKLAEAKSKILVFQNEKELATLTAPYDCKVLTNVLGANSGTEVGTDVMEIETISDSQQDKDSSAETAEEVNTRILASTMYGGILTYTAKEGKTVKKGEILVKLYNPSVIHTIEALKAGIVFAREKVADKKSKFERYSKLRQNNSTSIENFENMELAYKKAQNEFIDAKLSLEYAEAYNDKIGNLVAPYDCKVEKVIIALGSGTESGTPIMLISSPSDKGPENIGSDTATVTIGGTIDDGFYLTELPKAGEVIKKDSPLAKYVELPVIIEIRRAELALEQAKMEFKDREGDYKRCKYLADKNSNTKENCENSKLEYEIALNALTEAKANLDLAIERKKKTIIRAPFDCKVARVLLIQGSGTTFGTPVMEIEKL